MTIFCFIIFRFWMNFYAKNYEKGKMPRISKNILFVDVTIRKVLVASVHFQARFNSGPLKVHHQFRELQLCPFARNRRAVEDRWSF